MKKGKVFAVAGVTLLAAGLLAACSGSNTSKASSGEDKNYGYVYTDDPQTLDYTVSSKAATHDITTNVVDGLMANDKYGNLVPSLAEDWSVSKDGLTYTYKIRKGVKWYDADGEEHGEVTAKDFVTGLKHAADKKSEELKLQLFKKSNILIRDASNFVNLDESYIRIAIKGHNENQLILKELNRIMGE